MGATHAGGVIVFLALFLESDVIGCVRESKHKFLFTLTDDGREDLFTVLHSHVVYK